MVVRHVAFMMLAPFASGAEHQTLALCRYLGERCRITLLTNDEFAHLLRTDPFFQTYAGALEVVPIGQAFPNGSVRSLRGLASRVSFYPRLQRRAWLALRRLRPDLIHLVLTPSFFAYLPLFRILAQPVVMTLAGEMRYVRHFYGPFKAWSVRQAVRLASGLVACSVDELENLSAVDPTQARRAVVLDNFTDVSRWTAAEKDPNLVTFAARLHPEKGALLFIEAAALVAQTHPAVRFQLLGRGEQAAEAGRRIASLGLGTRIERGFTTDLAQHFGRSSIFVSCQRHENLGSSSLLEAMASENAVVATDVGQTGRIVDAKIGLRVPVDGEALAGALRQLLDDPVATRAMGRAARSRVLEHYGPGPYVSGLLQVYDRAILGHRASR